MNPEEYKLTLERDLKAEVYHLGFFLAGIAAPILPTHYSTYINWLAKGHHAEMAYLATDHARLCREDFHLILEEVRSILVLGLPYDPPQQQATIEELSGRVAAYASGIDYHEIIPPRLIKLALWMEKRIGRPIHWRGYTDTGPILERDLAQQAGLGWIGKNSCLISPRYGSYFLLAEILWDVDLAPDPPENHDYCGSCHRCIEACPTGSIQPDRTLDAGRCISYQTIENKGSIPVDLRSSVGNWVFGCDICQQVCPWNRRFAFERGDPEIHPQANHSDVNLVAELAFTQEAFRQKYRHSPVTRARRKRYLRNIAVALGNSRSLPAIPVLAEALLHDSEPLVRAHAAWALGQVGGEEALSILRQALSIEQDATSIDEIEAALSQSYGSQAGKAAF